ncbi:MAG: hypothetical protein Q4P29_00975, partial [Tissierellia bacterium]|nr:hypothetical protein [Tissierellia bacterium]
MMYKILDEVNSLLNLVYSDLIIKTMDDLIFYAQNDTVIGLNNNEFIKKKDILIIHTNENTIYSISHTPLDPKTIMDLRLISNGLISNNIVLDIVDFNAIKNNLNNLNKSSIRYLKLDNSIELFNIEGKYDEKEKEIVNLLNYTIEKAIILNASDIHIEPLDNSIRFRFRIDGDLQNSFSIPINNLDM